LKRRRAVILYLYYRDQELRRVRRRNRYVFRLRPRIHSPYPTPYHYKYKYIHKHRSVTRFSLIESDKLRNTLNNQDEVTQFKFPAWVRWESFLMSMAHPSRYRMIEGHHQWARNSIRMNQHYWIEEIIRVLNAPDSPDRIAGWSIQEYREFIDAPPNNKVPNDAFRNCIGSVWSN